MRTGLIGALLGALFAVSCATYNQDLDRARRHYESNQFEPSLALLRVLEPDMDSFNQAEQAQYAYLRGMTDYRLSTMTQAGTSVSDPKKGYRDNARHWLGVARAIDKQTPGGLTEDEKGRLEETIKDLNHDWYAGEEEVAPATSGSANAGAPPAKGATSDVKSNDAKPPPKP